MDSALPRKNCGSWSEFWREFFFPPGHPPLSLQPEKLNVVPKDNSFWSKPRKLICSILPLSPGQIVLFVTNSSCFIACLETGLCTATYTSLQQWDEHAHCLPFLYLLFPSGMVPHELQRWLNSYPRSLYLKNIKRQNQETLLLMLPLHTWSMLQRGASLVVSTQLLMGSCCDMALKILVFYQVIFEAAQFASQHIDLVHSMAVWMVMLVDWWKAAPFTGVTLQPLMLGAMANPWTCPLLPANTNHCRVRISALQQKSTQEKSHCSNVIVLKIIAGRRQCIFNGQYYLHIS